MNDVAKIRIEAVSNGWIVYLLGAGESGEKLLGRYCFTNQDSLLSFVGEVLPKPVPMKVSK